MLKKLKASSLLHAVFVCLLIAMLCFGMLLLASYNSLFQKRILQKTQLQLTNDSAIELMLSKISEVESESAEINVFGDHIMTNAKIFDWGFYKIVCAKTFYKKDTIQKNILVGEVVKPSTALYVTNYDKIVSMAGHVNITGDICIPKGILEKKNIYGELTEVAIQGIQKTSEGRLPRLRKIDIDIIPASASIQTTEVIEKEKVYVQAFDENTQVFQVNDLSFLQGKTVKGNIIFQSNGTLILKGNMKLEDVIIKAKKVVVEKGFSGNVQIIASTSVIVEDEVQLKYPSSILIQKPEDSATIVIGKKSILIGGIIMNNIVHQTALKSILSIDEETTIIGTIYCYGALELKGNVYGSVYADRLYTKTNESDYTNLLMNAEIDIRKLPEDFIGIPLFDIDKKRVNVYKAVKEL